MILTENRLLNFQVAGEEGGGTELTEETAVEGESGTVYENIPADTTIENGGADVLIPA